MIEINLRNPDFFLLFVALGMDSDSNSDGSGHDTPTISGFLGLFFSLLFSYIFRNFHGIVFFCVFTYQSREIFDMDDCGNDSDDAGNVVQTEEDEETEVTIEDAIEGGQPGSSKRSNGSILCFFG